MWPQTTYLICNTPRSGSNLLSDVLTGTGVAGRPREYFLEDSLKYFFEEFHSSSYLEYVHRILEETPTPNGVFGGKLAIFSFNNLINQVRQSLPSQDRSLSDSEVLADLFPNLHYIYLTRRNKVRQAISAIRAFKTKVWHTYNRAEKPAVELSCEPEDIDHYVQVFALQEACWQEFFSQNGITPLTLVYEDFSQNLEQAVHQVLDYLKIPAPPDWDLSKTKIGIKLADTKSDELTEQYLEYRRPIWDRVSVNESQLAGGEADTREATHQPILESQLLQLLDEAYQIQQNLRQEPVIGGFTWAKRPIYTLNNSTFSRQFNLNEILVNLLNRLYHEFTVAQASSQQELAALRWKLHKLTMRVEKLSKLDQSATQNINSDSGARGSTDNSAGI